MSGFGMSLVNSPPPPHISALKRWRSISPASATNVANIFPTLFHCHRIESIWIDLNVRLPACCFSYYTLTTSTTTYRLVVEMHGLSLHIRTRLVNKFLCSYFTILLFSCLSKRAAHKYRNDTIGNMHPVRCSSSRDAL